MIPSIELSIIYWTSYFHLYWQLSGVPAFSFFCCLYRLKDCLPIIMSEGAATFEAPLTQGFGYGIILGLGFAFALLMIFITWALKR